MTQTTRTIATRTAAALYILNRTSWTGNWRTALCDYSKLGLPNVSRIVQNGTVEEALDALKVVHARGAHFAAKAVECAARRLPEGYFNDAEIYANCAARCRIAYRALLVVVDSEQANHHAARLLTAIGSYLKASYNGPALPPFAR